MAYRLANELQPGEPHRDGGGGGGGGAGAGAVGTRTEGGAGSVSAGAAGERAGEREGGGSKIDEDEEKDAVFYRLEMLGYRVGQGLVER